MVGLWAEHDEFGVGFDPDTVPGRPVEQVAIRAAFLGTVAVRDGDGAGDHVAPVRGVAVVVFETGEQWGEVGTCTQREVLAGQGAGGVPKSGRWRAWAPGTSIFTGRSFFGMCMMCPSVGGFWLVVSGWWLVCQEVGVGFGGGTSGGSASAPAEREESLETTRSGCWGGCGLEHADLSHLVRHGGAGELVDRADDLVGRSACCPVGSARSERWMMPSNATSRAAIRPASRPMGVVIV